MIMAIMFMPIVIMPIVIAATDKAEGQCNYN